MKLSYVYIVIRLNERKVVYITTIQNISLLNLIF